MVYVSVLGVFVAGCVAVIGYFQWQTAHHRIVLDLFDKRLATYDELREVISKQLTSGAVPQEMLIAYIRALNRAHFLFGPEVTSYLKARYKDLVQASMLFAKNRPLPPETDRERAIAEMTGVLDRLTDFYKDTDALFYPYMRLHQKLPYTWWPFDRPKLGPRIAKSVAALRRALRLPPAKA
jgi:hypothetical protein